MHVHSRRSGHAVTYVQTGILYVYADVGFPDESATDGYLNMFLCAFICVCELVIRSARQQKHQIIAVSLCPQEKGRLQVTETRLS